MLYLPENVTLPRSQKIQMTLGQPGFTHNKHLKLTKEFTLNSMLSGESQIHIISYTIIYLLVFFKVSPFIN